MRLILFLIAAWAVAGAYAQTDVRFGNESSDTATIDSWLIEGAAAKLSSPEERVAFFGRKMLGTPYAGGTLEGSPERLTVRLDSTDCTTFVETCMALAYTLGEGRSSWRDFVYNLQRLRYRGGIIDGYPSRLHYISDWAADNRHRGNFREVTETFPRASAMQRSIDFMSANRDRYPALADSAVYERIRSIENGYRRHKFVYIKTIDLGSKTTASALHTGDVVALVSRLNNLDVTHMGMIVKEGDVPYLLHASSSEGRVMITKQPLAEFVKRNRQWIGIRVFRLND